ncbi:hypothetical protein ONA70_10780 [Micromonospora yasonensis]|uniref:hypothetical protein n=1 Tax=Micromonospora yasonensis TaxID=1128667 RepID=UPI002230EC0C|nr:hypothetical protein [Micromonospora yasonensis]MCW3840581.1 hypothetical protein [Micromonospora yasonensis]
MWEPLAASMAAMTAAAVLVAPTPTPPVDATPVLTTAPFGALPGQQVTHTITISGTASLTDGQITFTTTADLEEVKVHAVPGRCTVAARTVVCDLGDVRLAAGAAAPRITITGRISAGDDAGADVGAVVRNRVTLTAAEFTDDDAQVASNAYLLPGAAPTTTAPTRQQITVTADPGTRRSTLTVALAALAAAALVVGGALLARRRRHPGDVGPPPVAPGRSDPM